MCDSDQVGDDKAFVKQLPDHLQLKILSMLSTPPLPAGLGTTPPRLLVVLRLT